MIRCGDVRGSRFRWALSPTIALSIFAATTSVRAVEPPTPSSEPSQIEIDAAIARAKAAAKKRDYATALAEFEKARAMKATAQLHFNVAVCHQALMLGAAEGTPERDAQRQAAIAAYREYLAAAPDASDRADVERIVVELGGTTGPEPAPEPDDSPALPELREIVTRIDPEPEPEPEPAPKPDVPVRPPTPVSKVHGRVGPFVPVVLAHMGRLGGRTLVSPMIGLGVRGGVFLGARERLNLGGELSAYGMPSAPSQKHVLVGAVLAATLEYGDTVGKKKRFAIAGGLVIGPAFESLRYHGNDSGRTACAVKTDEASSRAGAVLAPRLALMLLLGRRRNHELGLRITPALALFGNGSSSPPSGATSCAQTPFAEVGLPGGPALVTTIDLGYAPRL